MRRAESAPALRKRTPSTQCDVLQVKSRVCHCTDVAGEASKAGNARFAGSRSLPVTMDSIRPSGDRCTPEMVWPNVRDVSVHAAIASTRFFTMPEDTWRPPSFVEHLTDCLYGYSVVPSIHEAVGFIGRYCAGSEQLHARTNRNSGEAAVSPLVVPKPRVQKKI